MLTATIPVQSITKCEWTPVVILSHQKLIYTDTLKTHVPSLGVLCIPKPNDQMQAWPGVISTSCSCSPFGILTQLPVLWSHPGSITATYSMWGCLWRHTEISKGPKCSSLFLTSLCRYHWEPSFEGAALASYCLSPKKPYAGLGPRLSTGPFHYRYWWIIIKSSRNIGGRGASTNSTGDMFGGNEGEAPWLWNFLPRDVFIALILVCFIYSTL